MNKHNLRLFWVLLLSTFLMAVNPVYAKDMDSGVSYNAMKTSGVRAEEGIVILNVPIELVKREAIKALTAPGTQILSLDRFDFDPMDRLVIMEGVAELPVDILKDMNEIAGAGEFKAKHRFNISFKLPTAKKLALTRYFQIEFVEFKLDGHSYLNALNRASQYLVGLLTNTSFMNYMLDVKPELADSEENLAIKIKKMIEQKGLRFRGNTISVKLDFTKIPQLKDYAEIADIRMWQINPVLLKGTDMMVLRVEAGLGKPGQQWLTDVSERYENDTTTLEEQRAELYAQYSDPSVFNQEIQQYIDNKMELMNFVELQTRDQRELDQMKTHIASRTREALNVKNPLFKADPEKLYETFKRDTQEYISDILVHIKRKNTLDNEIRNGGDEKNRTAPFLEQRISQATITQAARFFREFEFENEQMFPQIDVYYAPHIPGIVLKGIMNMDINVFMEMGLEGSGIEWSKKPWRAAEDTYGAGLPFEVSLRVRMLDEGELGLDIKSFSILTGSERTFLSAASGHGSVMANWVKMALVNTMATTLIEDPTAMTPTDANPNPEEETSYQTILKNITRQATTYQQKLPELFGKGTDGLSELAKIDIEGNPFILAGKEKVAGKAELFFKELITYDEASGLIKFKLDPRIVTDTILATDNKVQVWNIESLFDKKFNQTYLDLSLGYGVRSRNYVERIHERAEYFDSQEFVGINESLPTIEKDLGLKLNLSSLERLINQVLADAYRQQNKDVEAQLRADKEQSYYMVKDMSLKIVRDGVMRLSTTISHIAKSKRGWYNPARWFGETYPVTSKTITVNAQANLSVEELSKYADKLKTLPFEVFLGKELLKFDLLSTGIKFEGDTSVLDKTLGLIAGNIDFKKSSIAKKVKKIALNFVNKYVNDQSPQKNGSTELSGVKINKFVKIIAHDEEILMQLNPHLMANAFEVRLLPSQKFNGENVGLILNKRKNTIAMDFSTSGNMANVDKGELIRIMEISSSMTRDILKSEDREEVKKALTTGGMADKLIRNSDYTKLSLSHRLMKVLSQYNGVVNVIKPDMTVINQINRNLNSKFGASMPDFNDRRLTTTGVEVMYIVAASHVLATKLEAIDSLIKDMGLEDEVLYADLYAQKAMDLRERIVNPLIEIYAKNFKTNNAKIVKKGPTDWNHSFYPEAIFADAVFKLLNK